MTSPRPTARRVMTDLGFTIQSTWWGVKPPAASVSPRPPTDTTDGHTGRRSRTATEAGGSRQGKTVTLYGTSSRVVRQGQNPRIAGEFLGGRPSLAGGGNGDALRNFQSGRDDVSGFLVSRYNPGNTEASMPVTNMLSPESAGSAQALRRVWGHPGG
jgi:hypothetical protein